MFLKFYMTLQIFSILYGLLPLLFFFLIKRKVHEEVYFILPFLYVVFIAGLYEFICTILLGLNVKYWFIIYNFLSFTTLLYFYFYLLKKQFRVIYIIFSVLFILITTISFSFYSCDNFIQISSYYKILQTIMILTFSVLWIKRVFLDLELSSLSESSTFYFISGLLLYYSGTVFLFLLSNMIFKMDKSTFQDYWMLNVVLNLVLRTLLIIGIWKGRVK